MNTDELAINWQSFAPVRLQFKFAFIIRALGFHLMGGITSKQACRAFNIIIKLV